VINKIAKLLSFRELPHPDDYRFGNAGFRKYDK
jgi:hypothetical protein